MNKKLYTLLFFLLVFVSPSLAQFSRPVSVGVGGGGTMLFGDMKEIPVGLAGHIDLDALITPYLSVGINTQAGKLMSNDGGSREATNKYIALNGNVKLRAGQFFAPSDNYSYYMLNNRDLKSLLMNFYVGAGLGIIRNNVERTWEPDNSLEEAYVANDKKADLIIPLNFGIDIPFGQSLYGPTWALNLNYNHSLATEDNLDGRTNPNSNFKDQYNYWSIGVKVGLFNRN